MLVLAAIGLGASAAEASETRVDRQTYVSDLSPLDPYTGQADRPRVALAAGRTLAHALIHLSYSSPATEGSLSLRTANLLAPLGDDTFIKACPLTSDWSIPLDRSHPPQFDCAALSVPVESDAEGRWTLDLSSFLRRWDQNPNFGLALLPVAAGSETWQIDFDPQGTVATTALGELPVDPGDPASGTGPPVAEGIEQPPPLFAETPSFIPTAGPTPEVVPLPTAARAAAADGQGRPWWPWVAWAVALAGVLVSRSNRATNALNRVRHETLSPFAEAGRRRFQRLPAPVQQAAIPGIVALAVYAGLSIALPQGVPAGVVVLGLILGALTGLTALGLVLVFRVLRAINMAQAVIGTVTASTAIILVTGAGWSYAAAVPVGLAVAALTGLLVEAIMYRFRRAPRLIVTVATIGVAQILAAVNLAAPRLVSGIADSATFTTPFHTRFTIKPVTFTADAVAILVVVPVVLVALAALLAKTNTGRALRAVADSTERAELVGIPIRRMLRITWVVAAGLSGVAAILAAPIVGANVGVATGPETLLAPLAAAVLGRMENLSRTMIAGLAIGVTQQAFFWSYPRSSTVDVILFVVILVGLMLFVRSRPSRISDPGLGQYRAVMEPRPISTAVSSLRSVAATRVGIGSIVAVLALAAPVVFSESDLIVLTYITIFGIVAVSLVVLTGWAGQVTLGQFALAGVGASCTAFALSRYNLDLFAALSLGAVAAALVAVVIGMSTLRLPGQFAAVATLAFAVPASTFLLNPTRFPDLNPVSVTRPVLFGRFPLEDNVIFYYLALAFLCLCFLAARNIRRSRFGRTLIAVRDNERAAAAWSIAATRARLTAFAVAGGMAGLAGALYTIGLRGVPYSGFTPLASLEVFTMAVVGGLGSLPGALLGAVYVGVAQSLLGGAAQLLATGAGLLILLLVIPEGIGGAAFRLRDWWYGILARRRGVTLFPTAAGSDALAAAQPTEAIEPADGQLTWSSVSASYGRLQVLFDVSGTVRDGETLALLGTNGAGKSTLLRVLAGVLPARGGSIVLDGQDISRLSPQERLRRGLVTVPGQGVFPSLTVDENLRLFAWTAAEPGSAVRSAYTTFPRLRERSRERASQLSGGEQQMLSLAQAIICEPRVLLVDELTAGLSPAAVATLLDVLDELRARGVTAIIVEQSLNTAASIATRCNFMERGRNRYDGSIADLVARTDLARAVFMTQQPPLDRVTESGPTEHPPIEPILSARGVRKHYGGIVALDGVSIDVYPGEIAALIGPNGAGKTTLLDICSGFVKADVGSVYLAGDEVTQLAAHERADLALGRIFQDARLIPSLTVRETVATALERHVDVRDPLACLLRVSACTESERAIQSRVDELLELFGLQGYGDTFISELSTGTRRVVEIACSVAHGPSVLLLDEPTAGVAQRESESLAQRLQRARQDLGLAMLVVEHDLSFVSTLADRVVCLDLGRELAVGTPDEVLADPRVLHAYFGIEPSDGAAPTRQVGAAQRAGTNDVVARTSTARPRTPARATSSPPLKIVSPKETP